MSAKAKQLKGRIKQATGSLTGNRKLEREGRIDRHSAEAETRLEEATDKVKQAIDKAADAVTDAIHTGRKARRRS